MATVPEDNYVLLEEVENNGIIILNRPEEYNALTIAMVEKIHSTLKSWESDKKLVIIKGIGDKVFSTGDDLKRVYHWLKCDQNDKCLELARKTYTLNYLIASYKKPYIAIMDGITMGAGAGLSVHGKYRIATENTLFAMPETAVGFYPDVGSTYFLSRLKGKLGLFLGLTGYRLKDVDVLHAGLATHYVPSTKLQTIIDELLSENSNVDTILEPYLPKNINLPFSLQSQIEFIDECFSSPKVETIINRLNRKNSSFSKSVLKMLEAASPTALKVTIKSIEEAANKSLAEALIKELRLTYRCLNETTDFFEGIRAVLIKNTTPNWNLTELEDVWDDFVNEQFEPLPEELELVLS